MGCVPGAVLIISDLCRSSLIGEVINICHMMSSALTDHLSSLLGSQLAWLGLFTLEEAHQVSHGIIARVPITQCAQYLCAFLVNPENVGHLTCIDCTQCTLVDRVIGEKMAEIHIYSSLIFITC